ncbi:hypothetical protein EJB05_02994, partial [Eragrostis curvula]
NKQSIEQQQSRTPATESMAVGDSTTPPVAKISISGATLAQLLHRCAAAAGDCDGLLFGRASRLPAPPPSLSDYDDGAAAPPAPALSIAVSGHCSLSHPSSLSDPLGRFHPPSAPSPSAPVGFFSSRRRTALRPSMRELAVAHSLSKSLAPTHPLLFLLVSPSFNAVHSTHSYDYRAFLLTGARLVPTKFKVVNLGPGFRDQYHSFSAESPLPGLPPPQPSSPATGHAHSTIEERKAVDVMVDGFSLEMLQGVIGSAAGQTAEMDEMYEGMLRRLEKLAREVEQSNLRVLEQVLFPILQFMPGNAVYILIDAMRDRQLCVLGVLLKLASDYNCTGLNRQRESEPGSEVQKCWIGMRPQSLLLTSCTEPSLLCLLGIRVETESFEIVCVICCETLYQRKLWLKWCLRIGRGHLKMGHKFVWEKVRGGCDDKDVESTLKHARCHAETGAVWSALE